jgi:hypothetical protein
MVGGSRAVGIEHAVHPGLMDVRPQAPLGTGMYFMDTDTMFDLDCLLRLRDHELLAINYTKDILIGDLQNLKLWAVQCATITGLQIREMVHDLHVLEEKIKGFSHLMRLDRSE